MNNGSTSSADTKAGEDEVLTQPRILVIEDETDIRDLVRFNLERKGFDVDLAEGGERGLALVRGRIWAWWSWIATSTCTSGTLGGSWVMMRRRGSRSFAESATSSTDVLRPVQWRGSL